MEEQQLTETSRTPSRGLFAYLRESVEELRRVNWPTRDEVIQGTQTVLLFVIGATLFLWVVDLIFRLVVNWVI